jgi:hypothetical protein
MVEAVFFFCRGSVQLAFCLALLSSATMAAASRGRGKSKAGEDTKLRIAIVNNDKVRSSGLESGESGGCCQSLSHCRVLVCLSTAVQAQEVQARVQEVMPHRQTR